MTGHALRRPANPAPRSIARRGGTMRRPAGKGPARMNGPEAKPRKGRGEALASLVRRVAELMGTPVAVLHIPSETELLTLASAGPALAGPAGWSLVARLSAAALLSPEGLVVPDRSADPRFAGPGDPQPGQPRFYAGMPVVVEGHPPAVLCAVDIRPHPGGLTPERTFALRVLAEQAAAQLALSRAEEPPSTAGALPRRTLPAARDAILDWDLATGLIAWNEALEANFGWRPTAAEATGAWWLSRIHPEDRERVRRGVRAAIGAGAAGWGEEYRFRRADGSHAEVLERGHILRDGQGQAVRMIGVLLDLSEQRRAEAALRASEKRLQALVSASADVIYGMSPDWSELRHLTGKGLLRDAKVASANWLADYIHPEDQPEVLAAVSTALRNRAPLLVEHRVRLAGGGLGWIRSHAVPVLDEAGRITEWFGTAVDITAMRAAAERRDALLELADRLRETAGPARMTAAAGEILGRTLGATRGGYGEIDAARGTVDIWVDWRADPAVPSVSGVHAFGDYGSFIEDLRRGEVVAVPDVAQDPRTSAAAASFEAIQLRALLNVPLMDGGRLAAVVLAHSDRPRCWAPEEIAFARAVADRTWAALRHASAEAELRRVNGMLEQRVAARTADRNRLWRMSRDLMLVAGFEGQIVTVNPAWQEVLGWSETELRNASLFALLHPDDLAQTRAGVREIAAGTAFLRFDSRCRRVDGGYSWISWTAGPADGLIVAVGRDTTAEREQAEALRHSEEQLRQSQKMEAVGQLTGGVAHDFNNLLTGISGSLELLSHHVAQGRVENLGRFVSAAQGAAQRAAALTHRLLAFSRRQALDPRPIDLNALVAGLDELLRRTLGPGIALEVTAEPGLWTTLVDPSQLENALLNLCINARDAMPEGGRLALRTANCALALEAAREMELVPGDYVTISVADTGVGMTAEVQQRAFEPFFTTKPMGQGTGLGLSMIYGFVRQSGGQVRIETAPGTGTLVRIVLPRHLGRAEALRLPGAEGPSPALAGGVILVVDDEPTVRALVADILEELGYTVLQAADGPSGLRLLQSSARIDLLISDVGLPGGMTGRHLVDAAQRVRPGLRALFITGYAEHAVVREGRLEPGTRLLAKPFSMQALTRSVAELLRPG